MPGIPHTKASILLVDDNTANLLAAEAVLEPLNQRLVRASSGPEALRLLETEPFAVVVLDVRMPGMDGLETARRIRGQLNRSVPIIFLTADPQEVFRGYEAGAVDYLVKPYPPDVLRTKVAVFVELFLRAQDLQRREAELHARERQANEAMLRRVIDSNLVGLVFTDASSVVVDANDAFLRLIGFGRDELLARRTHWDELFAPSVAAVAGHTEGELRRRDGQRLSVMVGSARVEEKGLDVSFVLDLSELKQAQRDKEQHLLRERVARAVADAERTHLRRLFQQAPVPICLVMGKEQRIELANPPFLALANHRRLVGLTVGEAFPELTGQQVAAVLEQVSTRGEPYTGSEVPLTLERVGVEAPQARYFNFTCQPMDGPHGVEGVMVVALEVTDQVRGRQRVESLAADLEKAVKARDEFLSIASHELKTPLTPLQLRLSALLHEVQRSASGQVASERVMTAIAVSQRQVRRLADLVNELLDLSRITEAGLSLQLEEVDLLQVVREVVDRFDFETLQAGCQVRVEAPKLPVLGLWDRLRLEQVITNLLSNAVKYGKWKPIDIAIEMAEDCARLKITDHGIGIAPDSLPRLFGRFERGVSGRHYGGLGLGLYISRQIVERLGGRIGVNSELGKGATFVVELPKSPAAKA
jgi:PAS domain S-box-containing protein